MSTAGRAPFTDRLLESLPPVYLRADAANGGALEAYVSSFGDLGGLLELWIDLFDYRAPDEGGEPGDTSRLVDPATTPQPAWLAWMLGVDLPAAGVPRGTEQATEARELIAAGVNGIHAGSRGAIIAAARRWLNGGRTVLVTPGANPDPFTITVSVVAAEVVDLDELTDAIAAVLPAGHGLDLNNDVGNWAGVEQFETWADLMAAAPTWADVEDLWL